MTDNVKILFEAEDLRNASPATVSRAGIIFVSEEDLGNQPLVDAWLAQRRDKEKKVLSALWDKFIVECEIFEWLKKNTNVVFPSTPKHLSVNLLSLLAALLRKSVEQQLFYDDAAYEKMFMYCVAWSIGGLFEREDQLKFHNKLFEISSEEWTNQDTIYEYYVHDTDCTWIEWKAPVWNYPKIFKFSECLIPTRDSVRAEYLLRTMCTDNNYPTLVLGSSGTGKTSTIFQFFGNLSDQIVQKSINFSSATTCGMFQTNIEADIEKRQGKTFAPPFGRRMIVFLDDISMPEVNTWGDQPTLEIVRQLVEYDGFYFLEKDKRGDRKTIELMDYVAAMSHPGGGRNDIPNRLKRHFYVFNITPPSNVSIDNIYGQMLRGRFGSIQCEDMIPLITMSTIKLWLKVKAKMLPTPSKFHYVFNLFDLSRVFQGVLLPDTEVVKDSKKLIDLWIHECERVFCDKLVSLEDQNWYKQTMKELIVSEFGEEIAAQHTEFVYWADFFREDIIDEETDEVAEFAPKIYEAADSFDMCRTRVEGFLAKYNAEGKLKEMTLVLFTDAVKHLMRICRILGMPRGNLLFVGVGGSGRQSLTKLASYICRYELCQIQLTRNYKTADLLEDIKNMCILCGKEGKKVTFLVSDSDIVHEDFLEYINMMLATGMIAGLFAKEERDMMAAEIRPIAKKEVPNFDDTHETLVKFLMNRIRENFHIVLAFSPANTKFAERARKFPALISGCTIDWFLRWPVDALMSVSTKFISDDANFVIECKQESEKQALIKYIARIHDIIVNCCEEYFTQYRRHVYVTPKSYLSFINMYKSLYTKKREEIDRKARNVSLGLSKIAKASSDVNNMKEVLAVQKEELKVAEKNTQDMLAKLEVGAKEAEIQKREAQKIEEECQGTANSINKEKEEANKELQAALPFMEQAKKAAKSLNKKDIGFVAALPKPHDLIKRIMDCVSILLIKPLVKVEPMQIVVNKQPEQFIKDSYAEFSLKMMSSAQFIPLLLNFSEAKKDQINEETMELLEPYLNLNDFAPDSAKKIAAAASGLCGFVKAMFNYHKASLIVAPRLAALQIKEAELSDAMDKLKAAQDASAAAQAKVDKLENDFSNTMAEKKRIEDTAKATADKMIAATNLINSLAGERDRWTEDASSFKDEKQRLIGDAAMACAFVSYCGPFNQQYRKKILSDYFYKECISDEFNISVTADLNVNKFLCDDSQIAEWNSQTLPKDELSVQNGILVSSATRWPLIVDPQGQAAQWLKHGEASNFPYFGTTSISAPKLRDELKYAMQEGKTLLVEGVEEELDPMLDPVLEKNLFKQGKTFYVRLGDEDAEFDPKFKMFFITKLSAPHFTPELSAKTTVVDFAVTQKGLEDQLLSVVINQEQRSLEEQRIKLIEEVNHNTISLLNLDAQLLQKLSETEGDLLEDIELINVLNETKKSALEVKTKIESSKQTETMINKKREQYRSVARRGSILYFVMVDMALVNWMYQTSLSQFLTWFDHSLRESKPANLVNQRVGNIIDFMTYHIYDNVNRGLFGDDKLTFKLMCSLRICETEMSALTSAQIQTFLKCGSSLSLDKIKIKKPSAMEWITPTMWTNIIALTQNIDFYADLASLIISNEKLWRLYYEDEAPEALDIPILCERMLNIAPKKAAFYRMLLIRAIRDDRMTLVSKEFVSAIMGEKYVQPLTVTMDEVYACSQGTPIILMLTPGADPTQTLKDLARSVGVSINIVSMGEGQEPHASKAITDGMARGDWALLQNCHLGLKYMSALPDNLKEWAAAAANGGDTNNTFRLWITCEAHPSFPIALLQMSVKVTQEAPQGMKAGLLRSYTTLVNKDRLQRVDKQEWRDLVFCLCFLHSVVQERRKFGPLGWNIPYEFNESDLDASLMFLEKHMFTITDISWSTVQYMICEAQYGGRITDDFDRILFNTYGTQWLGQHCLDMGDAFAFSNTKSFKYVIPQNKNCVTQYQEYINTFASNDSPQIFGLHTNADLTYGTATANRILNTILETQPKESSSSSGKTREQTVADICQELLDKMPPDYVEEEVRDRIKKRPKHELEYVLQEKIQNANAKNGFEIPLNVFLYQEIVRLQRTIKNVRSTLSDLILAIDGVVIMTPNLQLALNSIFDAKPPAFWYCDASGAQIAWTLPTLSLWFDGLLRRQEQLTSWLLNGRPNVYWMTGFFNPQGFLTAMKQEVTRRHKHDRWALDDVILKTTILDETDFKKIRGPTDDGGVYIHGLFLDGCSWDAKNKILCESKPKELYTTLPIIHVTAITNKMAEQERSKSKFKLYECPVYTVPRRTDLNYVFVMNMPTKQSPNHWTLRGVAVLCSKD
eukprot:303595_1